MDPYEEADAQVSFMFAYTGSQSVFVLFLNHEAVFLDHCRAGERGPETGGGECANFCFNQQSQDRITAENLSTRSGQIHQHDCQVSEHTRS